MSSYIAKPETVERKWYVIDADGVVLGRLASQVALMLRGKHKPTFTPHVDTGDYIIVVNTDKIAMTGRKLDQKIYYHHSGYPGGLKETKYRDLLANKSKFALKKAVRGMLPKDPLGNKMFKKLKVYAGAEHPHAAQQPEVFDMK